MKKVLLTVLVLTIFVISTCLFINNKQDNHYMTISKSISQTSNIKENDNKPNNENLLKKYNMEGGFILIKKQKFKLYIVDDNSKVLATFDCALGKNSGQKEKEGDMRTPTGTFVIDEIIDASNWSHDFKDGKGEIAGAYGPWFISLDTSNLSKGTWGGIGIHGTHDPNSIGKRVSEGCIRLSNKNIKTLKSFTKIGMKVIIEE